MKYKCGKCKKELKIEDVKIIEIQGIGYSGEFSTETEMTLCEDCCDKIFKEVE